MNPAHTALCSATLDDPCCAVCATESSAKAVCAAPIDPRRPEGLRCVLPRGHDGERHRRLADVVAIRFMQANEIVKATDLLGGDLHALIEETTTPEQWRRFQIACVVHQCGISMRVGRSLLFCGVVQAALGLAICLLKSGASARDFAPFVVCATLTGMFGVSARHKGNRLALRLARGASVVA